MSLIVLEGLDGAGKSTQVNKIKGVLEERGREYEYLHFPRFDAPVYGDLVARFLRGEFGAVKAVHPCLVALIYAGDRRLAADMIRGWLGEGKVVLVDRYVISNIAYQCAKLPDPGLCSDLRQWILELEYGMNGIPRPDVSLFLDVPFSFTKEKLSETREGDDRDYLQGKKDIHEASLTLQKTVRGVYVAEAEKDPTFHVVDCSDADGNMLAPDETFKKIYKIIEPFI